MFGFDWFNDVLYIECTVNITDLMTCHFFNVVLCAFTWYSLCLKFLLTMGL